MTTIKTQTNAIQINNALIPKDSREVALMKDKVRLTNINNKEFIDIIVSETTIDGVQVTDVNTLFNYFLENLF